MLTDVWYLQRNGTAGTIRSTATLISGTFSNEVLDEIKVAVSFPDDTDEVRLVRDAVCDEVYDEA